MSRNCIAIIPARGGSKRLPRKNITPVLGRPMLSYPVTSALESRLFHRVVVSTEDKEIRRKAREAGASVMKRPRVLSEDDAPVTRVCQQVLEELSENKELPDYFCCIYATALFITPEDLAESFGLFFQEPLPDVVMGVSEFDLYPVQALEKNGEFLQPKWPEYMQRHSRDYPYLVASNGTFYWASTDYFLQHPDFYPKRLKGYTIPRCRSIDVDTREDLHFVHLLAEKIFGSPS